MISNTVNISKQKAGRAAGIFFLFNLIVPLFSFYILMKFLVPDNIISTAENIMNNEFLFRFYIIIEMIIAISGIILAVILYRMLKTVSKNLALLAFSWKLTDSILVSVITLLGFFSLQILNGESYISIFSIDQLKSPIGFFLNIQINIYLIPMLFLGLGLVLFNYLFYKSNYIPRIIALFGIISYSLISIYSLAAILVPDIKGILIIQIICWAPSCFFELLIGIWLIIRGVKSS